MAPQSWWMHRKLRILVKSATVNKINPVARYLSIMYSLHAADIALLPKQKTIYLRWSKRKCRKEDDCFFFIALVFKCYLPLKRRRYTCFYQSSESTERFFQKAKFVLNYCCHTILGSLFAHKKFAILLILQ